MSRKLLYFVGLSCTVIVVIASILHTLNPTDVEIRPWYGHVWRTSVANLMIGYFLFGGFIVGLVALMLEAQRAVQIKFMERKEKKREQTFHKLIRAREKLALEEYKESTSILRSLVMLDPQNVLAHILLITSLRDSGCLEEALKASDDARTHCKPNQELFLIASNVSIAAGNYTSAFDNLSLALAHEPKSSFILRSLVEVTVALDRIQDAIKYKERLVKSFSGGDEYDREQRELAHLELAEVSLRSCTSNEKRSALKDLLKRHRNYSPALRALAHCYLERKSDLLGSKNDSEVNNVEIVNGADLDEGLKLLIQAFKHDPNPAYLEDAAIYALEANQPARALNLVKTAIEDAQKMKIDVIASELLYVQLLIHLENNKEASERLGSLDEMLGRSGKYSAERKLLRAILLRHSGDYKMAVPQLTALALEGVHLPSRKLLKIEIEESGSYVVPLR